MIYLIVLLFIVSYVLCEIFSKEYPLLNSYKYIINFLFLLIFFILGSDNSALFRIQLIGEIQLSITYEILSYIMIYLNFMAIGFHDKELKKWWKELVMAIAVFVITGLDNINHLALFYPSLIYFFISDKKTKPFKTLLFGSWLSFILVENVSFIELDSVIFFVHALAFNYFYFDLYKKDNDRFYITAFPTLCLHLEAIGSLGKINNYVLLLILVLGIIFWIQQAFIEYKEKLILLSMPFVVYLGYIFYGVVFPKENLVNYFFIISMLTFCLRGIRNEGKDIFGIIVLFFFSISYINPNFILALSFKDNNLISIYYLIIIISNLLVGIASEKYIVNIIGVNGKKSKLEEVYSLNSIPIIVAIFSAVVATISLLESNTIIQKSQYQFDEKLIVYVLAFMSYFFGVMIEYIKNGSGTLMSYVNRMYYFFKTCFNHQGSSTSVDKSLSNSRGQYLNLGKLMVMLEISNKKLEKDIVLLISMIFMGLLLLVVI